VRHHRLRGTSRDVAPVLLESLRRVTCRGYDSFGVALTNGAGIQVYKSTGVIEHQQKEVLGLQGGVGIGHTRWATVGKVSEANAHPHLDCAGRFAIIHNGDLDNFHVLKKVSSMTATTSSPRPTARL
jgi:glucosamine--fructose-6-phosphate aminotransferase (isomerizing)